MGTNDCEEHISLSDTIKINDVAANAVRRVLNQTPTGTLDRDPISTDALRDFILSHQSANIVPVRHREEHVRGCPECQKGE